MGTTTTMSSAKSRHNFGFIKKLKGFSKLSRFVEKRNVKVAIHVNRPEPEYNKDIRKCLEDCTEFKQIHHGIRYATKSDLLHNGSFHEAIGPVLVMAQCFCLMPVRGVRSKTVKGLSFRWLSFRTSYCLVYMVLTVADTLLTLNLVRHAELDVRNIEPLVFHTTILLASIGFLRLASKWPKLMRRWQQVERQLPAYHSWQEREELSKRIKAVTFVLITMSLTEHLLSTISAIHFANYCPAADDPIESFFVSVSDQIFIVFNYSPWLAWLGKILNVLLTFGWTYMDVFVLNIGIGLSSMFKRIKIQMERHKDQVMPESFWCEVRHQYMLICDLIEEVDDAVSGIIMLSFANNLYFVCIQCLKSINTMPSIAHAIYFYFSFMFLLVRTLAVMLYLAEVNDRSRDPLEIIKSVPTEAYYSVIERFVIEINAMSVTMTGLRYFDITRKLVLTVAGTIVTYELVLIQNHEDQNLWHCGNE
ncbi:gustatory receptor 5a [Musca autumnalis]|uniref:gustatory receptor 5a n=1 Tax=Musca autumnalis TaxID=221902 RepID=UPI003CF7A956